MAQADTNVALLQLLRKPSQPASGRQGLSILNVVTTEPHALTLSFEGSPLPLDAELFEIPVSLYPLRKGDRLLVMPLGGDEYGQRWAAVEKLNGGPTMATMSGTTSVQIEGIEGVLSSNRLIIPERLRLSLRSGDRVILTPVQEGTEIKYAILESF